MRITVELECFVSSSLREQKNILSRVKIDVHDEGDIKLLKKYIAMKVLMEARYNSENHSAWNVTAQFRGLLAYFGLNHLVLGADIGKGGNRILYPGEQGSVRNGYRLFHISDMGLDNWNRKFFNIGLDDKNNIVTQRVNTKDNYGMNGPRTSVTDNETWDLTNREKLRELFNEIQKEASYDNTFGYDLICGACFCGAGLLKLSMQSNHQVVFGAISILLNVVIFAVAIPPALTSIAMEHCVINPLKYLFGTSLAEKNDEFINEVTALKK